MIKLFALILAFSMVLCSCSAILTPATGDQTTANDTAVTTTVSTTVADTTVEDTTEPLVTLPCLVGLYDDLENNGTYTRLYDWNEPWVKGRDIAVFDVIPSFESVLSGDDYKTLWNAEAKKLSSDSLPKPYFLLEYTLSDGTERSVDIYSWKEADAVTKEGYIEIYLYDDIHQEDGVWYYHLTENTTDENSVISSIKITAGDSISEVKHIRLTAFIEGSSGAPVDITNG